MDVYWLEQTEAELPEDNDWLSASEILCLKELRFAKRRADWLLGRWTAKLAVGTYLNVPTHPQVLARLEIRPARSGAPQILVANNPAGLTISLSHRDGIALCAVARNTVELGCDLEVIEPHSDAFVADYFTDEERALIAGTPEADRSRLLALLWSAKESALKALQTGLRLDTRCVSVSLHGGPYDVKGWSPLQVRYGAVQIFHGWWQSAAGIVRTMVAHPRPGVPIPLAVPAYCQESIVRCA